LNLPHLYTTQGLNQLKCLVGHVHAHEKTGKLILIALGAWQLLIGTNINILNLPFKNTHLLGCCSWLMSIWQFMDKLGITLNITQAWLHSVPAGNDSI
jgi:hypothetical protein